MSPLPISNAKYIDEIQRSYDETGSDGSVLYDWRSKVQKSYMEGDVEGMKKHAAPFAEYQVIDMMANGMEERTRFAAAELVLGQTGHGAIQKVEHDIPFDKLGTEQLMSIIRSKLEKLSRLNPAFDIKRILGGNIIDAEYEEDKKTDILPEVVEVEKC